jgi:hypothetical protein
MTSGRGAGLYVHIILISMYGGRFSTIPAYVEDMLGTRQVGAIYGLGRAGDLSAAKLLIRGRAQRGVLVRLLSPQKCTHVDKQLIRHRSRWFSPVMNAFWTIAMQMLGEPSKRDFAHGEPWHSDSKSVRAG